MRESARAAGVDYLVAGSITRFTSERRRRGTGAGLIVPLIAGVRRQKTELVVGILVRIIDVRNGEIVTTASSHGTSDRKQVRVGALGLFVHGGGGIYSRESLDSRDAQLDEAIRAAVAMAAQGVINAAPRLRGEQ
jgi:curli biogenesis system outer membrane secretion channel CsgG